jgi:hypothetical protein
MKDQPIEDHEGKLIIELLRTIVSGCRRLLRLAPEIQAGPLGVDLRQPTITEFFKPVKETPSWRRRVCPADTKQKNKIKKHYNNISSIHDIFHNTHSMTSNSILYWEFKAG